MGLQLGFGAITAQRGPSDDRPWPQIYADAIAAAATAEEEGFESVWVGEHHFSSDGYLPAVFPMLAALAARTERVLLGTKVVLAPLHHPLRIAEDAAAVQILSQGRLLLGMALGYRDEELHAFGTTSEQRVGRLVECVEICRKAWTGEPFSHDGPTVHVEDLRCQPSPDPIPIWLGGRAPAALERVGRLADGFVASSGSPQELRDRLDVVDGAADAQGRPALGISTGAFVLVSETAPPPRADAGMTAMFRQYAAWTGDDPAVAAGRADAASRLAVRGRPDEVADQLSALASLVPPDRKHHLVVRLAYPGMTRTEVLDHVRLFAREVAPRVRSRVADASDARRS